MTFIKYVFVSTESNLFLIVMFIIGIVCKLYWLGLTRGKISKICGDRISYILYRASVYGTLFYLSRSFDYILCTIGLTIINRF